MNAYTKAIGYATATAGAADDHRPPASTLASRLAGASQMAR